jgi:hypothetical protein
MSIDERGLPAGHRVGARLPRAVRDLALTEEEGLTRVWNRATTDATLTRRGDQALQNALAVDGQIKNGGLLSALDYIDHEAIEQGAAGFEYFGLRGSATALRSALGLAFPDGPVRADEREEYTLGLPQPVLERIEGELEEAYEFEADGLDEAFARAYRERPDDFEPA